MWPCHLWERRGQQRRYARLRLWKGRLRPGWGAVCVPWTPARGSGGTRAWVSRALCEAPSDWLRPARRAVLLLGESRDPPAPQDLPSLPGGKSVWKQAWAPQEPQGTAVWGPAVTDQGAGVGSAGPVAPGGAGWGLALVQSCLRRSNDASCQSRASALTMASLAAPCQLRVS